MEAVSLSASLPAASLLACGAVFVAATFQTLTGFGFALLSTAVLLHLMEPSRAVVVLVVPSLVTAALAFYGARSEFVCAPIRGYLAYSLVGLALGVALLGAIPPWLLRFGMALLLLLALLGERSGALLRPLRWTPVSGIAGGLLAGGLGMPGPAVISWVHAQEWPFSQRRATTLALFSAIELVRAGAYAGSGALRDREALVLLPWLSVAAGVGVLAGRRLLGRLEAEQLALAMKAALLLLLALTLHGAIRPLVTGS
jgi:uncharacterized membrane protein YfcA